MISLLPSTNQPPSKSWYCFATSWTTDAGRTGPEPCQHAVSQPPPLSAVPHIHEPCTHELRRQQARPDLAPRQRVGPTQGPWTYQQQRRNWTLKNELGE